MPDVRGCHLPDDLLYGAGWMVIVKPDDWASVKPRLIIGSEVGTRYEAKMNADGFSGCACPTDISP